MPASRTFRVCPNCGAVGTADRTTCAQCGQLTALRIVRTVENEGRERGSHSARSAGSVPVPGVKASPAR